MLISKERFNKVFPNAVSGMYDAIDKQIAVAGCITKPQQAMFIAQYGHETQGYTRLSENLNYSANGLVNVFRKYFPTLNLAKQYERKPQAIANKVYANRMGNGSEASGDGWKYRGRGLPHLTGKDNYGKFQAWLGKTVEPEELSTDLNLAIKAGVWYWLANGLANLGSVEKVTVRINGGTNGLEERCKLYRDLMVD
jgi:uncharacterized protein HI_1415|nr:MAG TPA: Chitinase A [Caudoviricetes sp.]